MSKDKTPWALTRSSCITGTFFYFPMIRYDSQYNWKLILRLRSRFFFSSYPSREFQNLSLHSSFKLSVSSFLRLVYHLHLFIPFHSFPVHESQTLSNSVSVFASVALSLSLWDCFSVYMSFCLSVSLHTSEILSFLEWTQILVAVLQIRFGISNASATLQMRLWYCEYIKKHFNHSFFNSTSTSQMKAY